MKLVFKKINNEDEYQNFVEQVYFLADQELKKAEEIKIKDNHHDLALVLPKLVSIVNIIGYLRGQDNIFVDFRPHVSFQQELYLMEEEFEKRLSQLIDYIKTTDSKDLYAKWAPLR